MPGCGGQLIITECKCPACQLQMRGEFQSGQLSSFPTKTLTSSKYSSRPGATDRSERVLGISYPTIRNKLDEITAFSTEQWDIIIPEKTTGSAAEKKALLSKMRGKYFTASIGRPVIPGGAVQKLKDLQGRKMTRVKQTGRWPLLTPSVSGRIRGNSSSRELTVTMLYWRGTSLPDIPGVRILDRTEGGWNCTNMAARRLAVYAAAAEIQNLDHW